MSLRRRSALLACALTVLVSACSSGAEPAEVGAESAPAAAAAAVAPPDVAAAGGGAPGAAAAPGPDGAPDLVGLDLDALADAAADAGVAVQVVAFAAEDDTGAAPPLVTVQDPPAGTSLSRGRAVVVWLGTPPALPPRTAPAPALPPPAAAVEEEPVVADAVPATATSAVEPEADADPTGGGAVDEAPTPGPDDRPPAPTAPRSNIRRMPAAEPGTFFAGRASWYGEELRGSPMACGGRFDPDAATIASRELRCGTRVRITAAGGASTEAVVTDWGPAEWTGKRVDLSRAVFEHLAPASRGWLDVEVVVLGE